MLVIAALTTALLGWGVGVLAGCASTDGGASSAVATDSPRTEARPKGTSVPSRVVPRGELTTEIAGISIDHDMWSDLGYRWDWTTPPRDGRGGGKIRLFEPLGDLLCILDDGAWVSGVETTSGRVRWRAQAGSPRTIYTSIDRSNDIVLVSGRPDLFIFDVNTGGMLAKQDMEIVINTPPALTGGLAIYGTPTARMMAHQFGDRNGNLIPPPLDRGVTAWQYQLHGAIEMKPVIMGDIVGAVTQAGDVFFANARTGSGIGRASIFEGLETDPVTDGTLMFVASLDQSIYAFAPQKAQLIWRHRTASPLRMQPTVHDGTLYIEIPGEGLTAFDTFSGQIRWSNPGVRGAVVSVRGGKLLVFDKGHATLIEPSTGDVRAEFDMRSFVALRTAEMVDSDLFTLSPNGAISRFVPR
jgi:outer membrane protein assembly factor BamB